MNERSVITISHLGYQIFCIKYVGLGVQVKVPVETKGGRISHECMTDGCVILIESIRLREIQLPVIHWGWLFHWATEIMT